MKITCYCDVNFDSFLMGFSEMKSASQISLLNNLIKNINSPKDLERIRNLIDKELEKRQDDTEVGILDNL